MANLDSDIMAAQVNISPRYRPEGQKVTGDLRVCEATYTTTALEVTNDIIRWVSLPVGAIVFIDKCWLFSEGIGGTAIIATSFGDQLDNARYATADIALTAASSAILPFTPLTTVILTRYVTLSTSNILVTPITGTFPATVSKKIVGHFEYRMP
jgi:hypothetical protein